MSKVLSTCLEFRDIQKQVLRDLKDYCKEELVNCNCWDFLLKVLYFEIFLNLLFEIALLLDILFDSKFLATQFKKKKKKEVERLCKRLN